MNTALVAESFIALDPAEGTAAQLVSIQRDAQRAATLPGTRGAVQLRYHSLQLLPVELVDDLPGIWYALLEAVEGFLAVGSATVPFPTLEAEIVLQSTGKLTRFTAGKIKHLVDPAELIGGILDGAQAYFGFAPEADGAAVTRIGRLRASAQAAGLFA